MVEIDAVDVIDGDGHVATVEAYQGGSMNKNEFSLESMRFRRSERLSSILGKLRESRDEEWNHGSSGRKGDTFQSATLALKPDQANVGTDTTVYDDQRLVSGSELREGPDEERKVTETPNGARAAKSQGLTPKLDLKVTLGNAHFMGNRISSSKSPRKTTLSPRDGRKASIRNRVSFFDPKSDSSRSDSSIEDRESHRRNFVSDVTKYHRGDAKKAPSKSTFMQSKSISTDDSDRDSMTSSSSSGSDSVFTSSYDGSSTASSLKQRGNSTIDITDPVGDEPEVTSPIAEQASSFISKLVRNLQLHQTFGVPNKIMKHVERSQPWGGRKGDPKNATESREDEGSNSIVENGDRRKLSPVKVVASPPKGSIMDELKEKLAARALKIEGAATSDAPAGIEEGMSGLPKMAPNAVDQLTSTDAALQTELNTNATCSSFMACFESNFEAKKTPLNNWNPGSEFLIVQEISGPGKSLSINTTQKMTYAAKVPEKSEIGDVNLSLSSDSEGTTENRNNTNEIDCSSLAYSLGTEDEREPKISPSGSGDASMVPLRHGERERAGPSMPRQNPRSSSDELVIALSLSGESNNLIPSPRSFNTPDGRRPMSTGEKSESALIPVSKKGIILNAVHQKEHQEELLSKIQEFHQRKTKREQNGEAFVAFVEESLPPKNIKRLPLRPTSELPKASKKIAEAYLNALSKKKEDNARPKVIATQGSTTDAISGFKSNFDSLKAAPTYLSDDTIPATDSAMANNKDIMPSEHGMSSVENREISSVKSARETGINLGDLVSRIDCVVQRLVQSGKIGTNSDPSRETDLDRKASELLQNLDILRARRESGSSRTLGTSRSHSFSTNSVVDVSTLIPATTSAPTAHPEETQSNSQLPHISQGENSNIYRLRAKRDRAARDVQNRAQRLQSMSTGSSVYGSEDNPVVVDELIPDMDTMQKNTIGSSFSSTRAAGPPRPESFTPEVKALRHIQILRVKDRMEDVGQHRSSDFQKTSSEPSKFDGMTSWEKEQPNDLPVLLRTTSSGIPGNYNFREERSSAFTGSENRTSDDSPASSSEEADDATDYGSDDNSEQMHRIEKMVRELRARI